MARTQAVSVSADTRAVTTTDLLKSAALVFVLVDHVGYYFIDEPTWWRLFGRLAAPVFFFLIGFARSRTVPWTWLMFGAVLTGLDVAGSDDPLEARLNILINFALLRWSLPWIERYLLPRPAGLPLLVLACALAAPFAGSVLEYGSEGWLWALVGLVRWRSLEEGDMAAGRPLLLGVALAAAGTYFLVETGTHNFSGASLAVFVMLLSGLVGVLSTFRREDGPWRPSPPVASALRFGGRWSLEIYAAHLILLEVWSLAP